MHKAPKTREAARMLKVASMDDVKESKDTREATEKNIMREGVEEKESDILENNTDLNIHRILESNVSCNRITLNQRAIESSQNHIYHIIASKHIWARGRRTHR